MEKASNKVKGIIQDIERTIKWILIHIEDRFKSELSKKENGLQSDFKKHLDRSVANIQNFSK